VTCLEALAVVGVQAFHPPAERELLFTAYAFGGSEVMSLDLDGILLVDLATDRER
jgi:hypothetical protein